MRLFETTFPNCYYTLLGGSKINCTQAYVLKKNATNIIKNLYSVCNSQGVEGFPITYIFNKAYKIRVTNDIVEYSGINHENILEASIKNFTFDTIFKLITLPFIDVDTVKSQKIINLADLPPIDFGPFVKFVNGMEFENNVEFYKHLREICSIKLQIGKFEFDAEKNSQLFELFGVNESKLLEYIFNGNVPNIEVPDTKVPNVDVSNTKVIKTKEVTTKTKEATTKTKEATTKTKEVATKTTNEYIAELYIKFLKIIDMIDNEVKDDIIYYDAVIKYYNTIASYLLCEIYCKLILNITNFICEIRSQSDVNVYGDKDLIKTYINELTNHVYFWMYFGKLTENFHNNDNGIPTIIPDIWYNTYLLEVIDQIDELSHKITEKEILEKICNINETYSTTEVFESQGASEIDQSSVADMDEHNLKLSLEIYSHMIEKEKQDSYIPFRINQSGWINFDVDGGNITFPECVESTSYTLFKYLLDYNKDHSYPPDGLLESNVDKVSTAGNELHAVKTIYENYTKNNVTPISNKVVISVPRNQKLTNELFKVVLLPQSDELQKNKIKPEYAKIFSNLEGLKYSKNSYNFNYDLRSHIANMTNVFIKIFGTNLYEDDILQFCEIIPQDNSEEYLVELANGRVPFITSDESVDETLNKKYISLCIHIITRMFNRDDDFKFDIGASNIWGTGTIKFDELTIILTSGHAKSTLSDKLFDLNDIQAKVDNFTDLLWRLNCDENNIIDPQLYLKIYNPTESELDFDERMMVKFVTNFIIRSSEDNGHLLAEVLRSLVEMPNSYIVGSGINRLKNFGYFNKFFKNIAPPTNLNLPYSDVEDRIIYIYKTIGKTKMTVDDHGYIKMAEAIDSFNLDEKVCNLLNWESFIFADDDLKKMRKFSELLKETFKSNQNIVGKAIHVLNCEFKKEINRIIEMHNSEVDEIIKSIMTDAYNSKLRNIGVTNGEAIDKTIQMAITENKFPSSELKEWYTNAYNSAKEESDYVFSYTFALSGSYNYKKIIESLFTKQLCTGERVNHIFSKTIGMSDQEIEYTLNKRQDELKDKLVIEKICEDPKNFIDLEDISFDLYLECAKVSKVKAKLNMLLANSIPRFYSYVTSHILESDKKFANLFSSTNSEMTFSAFEIKYDGEKQYKVKKYLFECPDYSGINKATYCKNTATYCSEDGIKLYQLSKRSPRIDLFESPIVIDSEGNQIGVGIYFSVFTMGNIQENTIYLGDEGECILIIDHASVMIIEPNQTRVFCLLDSKMILFESSQNKININNELIYYEPEYRKLQGKRRVSFGEKNVLVWPGNLFNQELKEFQEIVESYFGISDIRDIEQRLLLLSNDDIDSTLSDKLSKVLMLVEELEFSVNFYMNGNNGWSARVWKIFAPYYNFRNGIIIETNRETFIPAKILTINYHQCNKKIKEINFLPRGSNLITLEQNSKADVLTLVPFGQNVLSQLNDLFKTDPLVKDFFNADDIVYNSIIALSLKYFDSLNRLGQSSSKSKPKVVSIEVNENERGNRQYKMANKTLQKNKIDILVSDDGNAGIAEICKNVISNVNTICAAIENYCASAVKYANSALKVQNSSYVIKNVPVLNNIKKDLTLKNIFNDNLSLMKELNKTLIPISTEMFENPYEDVFNFIMKEICLFVLLAKDLTENNYYNYHLFGSINSTSILNFERLVSKALNRVKTMSQRVFNKDHKLSLRFSSQLNNIESLANY